MRPITSALLANVFAGFKTSFRAGFSGVAPTWQKFATEVPSTAQIENYTWLGAWPAIREWLGDRFVKELQGEAYLLANKDYESTIRVPRNNLEDDQIGIFTPMFTGMGETVAAFPDQLLYSTLAAGFVNKCYDKQPFFDTDHPVNGVSVSNMQPGSGTPWFLLDTSKSLKPIIYQNRRAFDLTALDSPTDPNVFNRKEYIYGVDGRCVGGYGFWQMAVGSKADLSPANYEAARATLRGFKNEEGAPLGVRPTLLVVPGSLEGAGRRIIERQQVAGSDNEWAGTAELLVADWL